MNYGSRARMDELKNGSNDNFEINVFLQVHNDRYYNSRL